MKVYHDIFVSFYPFFFISKPSDINIWHLTTCRLIKHSLKYIVLEKLLSLTLDDSSTDFWSHPKMRPASLHRD